MVQFDILPVLSSLIAGELARARHISALDPVFLDLNAETEIGQGALATDSLDLLTLAAAVAEMFHLYETGVEEYLLRYRTVANWCEVVSVSLAKKAEQITFRTSGSTGRPKRCVHSLAELLAEAAEHAQRMQSCTRVLSMVPAHHIYGFIWTALLPARLEVPRVDARRWSPSRFAEELRGGDLIVGVPAHWTALSRAFDLWPQGVLGVTSGAPCPLALFEEVKNEGVDFSEVYGSSETGGIGTRSAPCEPFSLLSFWERDASADLLRTARAVGSESVQPPDQLEWVGERSFRVGARRDGAVQVGGNNVFPEQIANVIRCHPGVKDCSVRLMRPEEGNRLKAFIVWREDAPEQQRSEQSLRAWLEEKLQPFERPLGFVFGASLPMNELSKSADWLVRY